MCIRDRYQRRVRGADRRFAMRSSLLLLTFAALASAIDICGNYCGPSWCSGKATPECGDIEGSGCVQSASDCDESGPTDGSCADMCCKHHDSCCGSTDRTKCNDAIISCLKACPSGPGSEGKVCYDGDLPVPVDAILVAMELNPSECCGTSCDEGLHAEAYPNITRGLGKPLPEPKQTNSSERFRDD
eukprot:TRINITY_DN2049_c0_g1_i1.p1 TRINITY_DN2049_c0_g1~~TRINITY_DN2049_c0_g1_i1.p1  ORF type:complete len:187 (+),score=36.42 TRINITY_DN2049_c0_g1_i1:94-654(+)